ncbi:hypothetical protein AB0M23_28345 [Streptomyces sp. NPDC052077]|uniref:hypothetical protein n=1 Tax=Streptomyces sp. NPDC052077 TaxID=3154757 RepID=UPI0034296769
MTAQRPSWIDGVSLDGYRLRRNDTVLTMHNGNALGARSGVVPGTNGLAVTLSGTTISVGSGIALVYQPNQGVYRAAMTATSSATLQAAHATLSRIDLVYLRVWDNAVDASGQNIADVVYLPGTPSSTPSAPTPTGTQITMSLATITVPPVGGGAPSVSTTVRPYTVAPGGILPLQTSAPPSPYVGQYWDDQSDLRRYNGTSWETMQKVETVGWTTPSLGTGYTTGDGGSAGNQNGPIRYRRYVERGTPYLEWDGGASRTSGAQVANILSAALPSAMRPKYRASMLAARSSNGISGVPGSGNVVHSLKADFNTDGTVSLIAAEAGTSEAVWFSLRGIRYTLL